MALGSDLQADVSGFLTDIGRAMTLRRIVAGTYDPTTGSTSSDTTTDYAGRGRLGDYSDAVVDGSVIKQADRKATFLPTDRSVIPQVGDRIGVPDFNGDIYTVENFKMREVGGVLVSYTLQLRR